MDPKEFKEKIIPLQTAMQRLAEKMMDNVDDAEDIVQDVFLTLWDRRDELSRIVKLDSYCMQMVRTKSIDLMRKRKTYELHKESIATLTDNEVLMEIEESRQQSEMLYQMLGTLPEKQQQAIQMKYIENRSTKEIESALQMSSNNVYTTLSRGIQVLREQLKKRLNNLETK